MLSYQHSFHAGCMADVHKHTLLINTINLLKHKAPYINFVDTHAGRGVYDLACEKAQKTGEASHGILSLMAEEIDVLKPLKALQSKLKANHYPGSAKIIQMLSRKEDSIHLFELHNTEFKELKNRFNLDARIQTHHTDGFKNAVHALSDTAKNIVMIDPSFEIKSEYQNVHGMVQELLKTDPHATVLLWVPHLPKDYHKELIASLEADKGATLNTFNFTPMNERAMYASTVAIWNMPEGLEVEFKL